MTDSRWRRIRLAQRLRFLLERLFVRGPSFQLLVVAALIGVISLAGGILVLPVSESTGELGDAVWWAFLRLSDPGYLGDDVGAWRRVVSTVLTVAGYVVFLGALVAIMTQWLTASMRRLESGLTPVATRNHVVVLGWSNRTVALVSEIMRSGGRVKRFLARLHTSRLRLVILSDEVTARHAQALRDDAAIGRRARSIVLRQGTPLVVDDLRRVDCLNAAAVIIPSLSTTGSTLSADMGTIKALLSLSSYPGASASALPFVVAEIQDHRNVAVARSAYRGELEVVSASAFVSRLMTQNLRHPGLSLVYRELLSHQIGCGIYVREYAGPAGVRFGALSGVYRRAVPCGVVRWRDGAFQPHLNVAPGFPVEADDRLVFVAPSYEDTEPVDGPAAPEDPEPHPAAPTSEGPGDAVRRILILGWNRNVAALIRELGDYAGERFDVTVVSLVATAARQAAIGAQAPTVSCRHEEVDYAAEDQLRRLAPAAFDHIVLASSERLASGEESDTRAVMAFLLLQTLLEDADRRPHLLLELQDPDNEPLLARPGSEVLVTPLIVAHVVAQVALRRELHAVYDELFTAGGPELAFRPARPHARPDGPVTFSELSRDVRRRGETLLGIHDSQSGGLTLCPDPEGPLSLADNDALVVIATSR